MTRHADFTAATGIPVYFCDAYRPPQIQRYTLKIAGSQLGDASRLLMGGAS